MKDVGVDPPDAARFRAGLRGDRRCIRVQIQSIQFNRNGSLLCPLRDFSQSVSVTAAYVEDLGAKNRTTLNGRRLEGKTRLTAGDRISAGQVVVVFGGTKSSTGPVEFTPGGDDGPLRATVMTNLFGEDFAFLDATDRSDGLAPRAFPSFWAAAREAANSRLYGGIHFRAAIERGLDQGRCIGEYVNALRTKR